MNDGDKCVLLSTRHSSQKGTVSSVHECNTNTMNSWKLSNYTDTMELTLFKVLF